MSFVRVVVNMSAVSGEFDYHLPPELEGQVGVGHMVRVPFGAQMVQAIVIDIIQSYIPETDVNKLLALPTKDYGIFLVNNETKKSGVILPNTKGVTDIKSALTLIKQKYGISGNVSMYSFRTERITIGM